MIPYSTKQEIILYHSISSPTNQMSVKDVETAVEERVLPEDNDGDSQTGTSEFAIHPSAMIHHHQTVHSISVLSILRVFLSELLATALMLFMGCSGGLDWGQGTHGFLSSISFGFMVAILIQSFGHISGAHLNPCVTISAVLMKVIAAPVSFSFADNPLQTLMNTCFFLVAAGISVYWCSDDWCNGRIRIASTIDTVQSLGTKWKRWRCMFDTT